MAGSTRGPGWLHRTERRAGPLSARSACRVAARHSRVAHLTLLPAGGPFLAAAAAGDSGLVILRRSDSGTLVVAVAPPPGDSMRIAPAAGFKADSASSTAPQALSLFRPRPRQVGRARRAGSRGSRAPGPWPDSGGRCCGSVARVPTWSREHKLGWLVLALARVSDDHLTIRVQRGGRTTLAAVGQVG